jgi:peptidoglycan/LPS O-acetylase OafA/YrhL
MVEKRLNVSNPQVNRQYYHNIDVLRGIAILLVVIVHSTLLPGIDAKYFKMIASLGSFGVDLFFVISGFLITNILLRANRDKSYFKNFYLRRILRIFPLYYGFLIFFILILPLLISPSSYSKSFQLLKDNQLFYWLYIPNYLFSFYPEKIKFFHLWSLAIEEQYYMIWPLFVRYLNVRKLMVILIAVIITSFCLRCYFVSQQYNQYLIWSFTPIRLEAIALGSMVAILHNKTDMILSKGNLDRAICLLVLIIFSLLVYLKGFYWNDAIVQSVGILLMDLLFAFIIIKFISIADLKHSAVNNLLLKLGKYCYAIYMFHELILGRVFDKVVKLNLDNLGASGPYLKIIIIFSFTLILSYLAAWVSWNAYEKWFIKLKHRFT